MHYGIKAPSFNPQTLCNPIPRRHAVLVLAVALLLPGLPACAHDGRARAQPVTVSLIDRQGGQALPLYRKDGRAYVPGNPGSRYAIRLANQTGGRVLVVLSVDGVNVISGQTAALSQTGYVLDPWRSYDIAGWRKSDTEIAAFEFAALSDSYAARTGRPANVGVIGAATFLEKPAPVAIVPRPSPPSLADLSGGATGRLAGTADLDRARGELAKAATQADAAAPAAPSAESAESAESAADARGDGADRVARTARAAATPLAMNTERLGTAHGQREWSVSTRTDFERLSSSPQAVVEIAYDSRPNLIAAGVIPGPVAQARPFPGSDTRGFVPDPPAR